MWLFTFSAVFVTLVSVNASHKHHGPPLPPEMLQKLKQSKSECFDEFPTLIEEDDVHFHHHSQELSEDKLCFFRCVQQKMGSINEEDGTIVMEQIKLSGFISKLDDARQAAVVGCLEEIGQIEACEDMKKIWACYGLGKDLKKPAA